MTTSDNRPVVILGAGVIGLTVAHALSSIPGNAYKITIVARDMPEDLDSQGFASPWAGANWSPIGPSTARTHKWETTTFNKLWDMIPTGLVKKLPSRVYFDYDGAIQKVWYQDIVRNYRVIPTHELLPGTVGGVAFDTISVNPAVYLPWLKSELVKNGAHFVRQKVFSLAELAPLAGSEGVIVNASGLGARSLLGVEDTAMFPIRGQTIVVHAPEVNEFLARQSETIPPSGEATYIIPRPSPPGSVLLGGTFQANDWDTSLDISTASGIWERCAKLAPALKNPSTHIISHNVGLRPARKGGPRVEVEKVSLPIAGNLVPPPTQSASAELGQLNVVHAYGFGPVGYQNSWGAAEEVVSLMKDLRDGRLQ